jgi:hypothetical protein
MRRTKKAPSVSHNNSRPNCRDRCLAEAISGEIDAGSASTLTGREPVRDRSRTGRKRHALPRS